MVEPQFIDRALSKSLGPLMFKSWKPWATHSQIPFATPKPKADPRAPRGPGPIAGGPRVPAPPKPKAPVDPDIGDIFVDPNAPKEPEPVEPEVEEQPEVEPEVDEPEPVRPADFRLVRVFDFTAEPGKSYRYSIQLALWNPNRPDYWKPTYSGPPIPARIMADPGTMRTGTYRESAWSAPSEIVQVPTTSQVFAEKILPPTEEVPEQVAVVVAQVLDVPNGRVPAGTFKLRRGAVADGTTTVLQEDVVGKQVIIGSGQLETGMVLLDMRGGQELGPGTIAPAEMLFLDPKGNLIFRDSERDRGEVKPFRQLEGVLAAAPTPTPGPEGTKRPGTTTDDDDDEVQRLLREAGGR
jgi:hypothetical protein